MRTKIEIETAFADRSALDGHRSFFLVGIGGAGMSGIARMLKHRGFTVKGTDSTPSAVIEELRKEGIEVWIGHSGEFVTGDDVLVLTDAIDLKSSPEVQAARRLGCPLFRRSQVLGWLLRDKKTIAVTGTHGKTTTTGMIGAGLRASGLDPTIVVGAEVPEFGGAIVEGQGEWAVIEACEAYDSLRDFDPYIVVLTNLELDHVDFHGDWEGLKNSLKAFVSRIPPAGTLVFNAEDAGARQIADLGLAKLAEYQQSTFYRNCELHLAGGCFKLAVPGVHNVSNAGAASVVLQLTTTDIGNGLAGVLEFRGADRRLQYTECEGVTVVDDYAHHPTEITASLEAVRSRWLSGNAQGKLIVVFQPHLYSRTAPLIPEFASALSTADTVVLTDIYPARETPIPGVSSFRIAELVTSPCHYVSQRHLLARKVAEFAKPGDVVVGMGAGNISEFAPSIVQELKQNHQKHRGSVRVAVVYGGDSAEREVSILSGRAVKEALESKGHAAWLIDVSESLLSTGDLRALVGPGRPDACFLAVHGTHAEDGCIQGLMEILHIPYTGSGVQTSALAMDKELTKQVLSRAGLPVPNGLLLRRGEKYDRFESGTGWVVKPNAQGSTVGLSFVENEDDLEQAIEKALQYGDQVLVEEWLKGIEISVPVLGDKVLPVVEILPESGSYDFASKYTPGATNEICPARLTEDQTRIAKEQALKAHQALGCRGCTRTDMIVTGDRIVCLEVNTLPGMTATSLVPNSARAAGITFEDLCDWMVRDALKTTTL